MRSWSAIGVLLFGGAKEHAAVQSPLDRRGDRAPGEVGPVRQPVQRPELGLLCELPAPGEQVGVLGPDLPVHPAVAAAMLLVAGALVLSVLVGDAVDLQTAPALLERAQAEVPVLVSVDRGIEAAGV